MEEPMLVEIPERWWLEDNTARDIERMRQAGRRAGLASLRSAVERMLAAAGLPCDKKAIDDRIANATKELRGEL